MIIGQILFVLVISTVLAVISALLVGWRYRANMRRLMQAPLPAGPLEVSASSASKHQKDSFLTPVSLADNLRAYQRLLFAFIGMTVLISLSRTLLAQWLAQAPISLKTVATLGTAYLWPVLPVLAVIGRWTRWRFVGAMLAWSLFAIALLAWRTNDNVTMTMVIKWVTLDIGPPMMVVTALCLGGATRAIGPWLAPLIAVMIGSAMLGFAALDLLIQRSSPVIAWLINWLNFTELVALFSLAPLLLTWWPAKAIGHWLAAAYRKRQVSELFYLFTAVWTIALIGPALAAGSQGWWAALLSFTPLLWIPLGARVMQSRQAVAATGRPPTLLVLRVFQQDAHVQNLFDRVIERWRLTGNTVLIAGTDLLERTLDAEDIFTFIDGRLGERFIQSPADVSRRLADFELLPDVEGRFRVNECYCHDSTWQQALAELVHASDVVLMDLRNFVESNKGCLHELQVLATSPDLRRAVVLTNDKTQLPPAQAVTQRATDGRFVWLAQRGDVAHTTSEVLAPLFA